MSALNGDKSRFNRERKRKIAQRKRTPRIAGARSKGTQTGGKLMPRAATVGAGMSIPLLSITSSPRPYRARRGQEETRVAGRHVEGQRELRAEVMGKLAWMWILRLTLRKPLMVEADCTTWS